MKLVHTLKIPLSTVTGGIVIFLIAYFTEWRDGGVPVRPTVRGLAAIACYGAVVSTFWGSVVALTLSRTTAGQTIPQWVQIGLFLAVGMLTPLICVPFTAPREVMDFLLH